ncbi:DUF3908 family protein [Parageobacillus thermoglucosidasius]|uniref:DUF3908 family protein n=1 Tax=Parageobacillus thermoglucosidasius TaxID=1426 RepID=UPI00025B81C2|nr:DUF3908 family protein [Parageobacillus thermoglucosidasius]EID42870.1 putative phage protein [Parageobacillus thermoglucosidasius TNO-09.020]KYD17868.1 hypothetical protein B4168_2429 [Anoxybacillus flavithermus]OAO85351.1 hypothetical protein GT23_3042 [Parageobacillus thermoglucosidasius]
MEQPINYNEEFKDAIKRLSFSDAKYKKLSQMFSQIHKNALLESFSDNHFFYPKYVFTNPEHAELYFIEREKVLLCKATDNEYIFNLVHLGNEYELSYIVRNDYDSNSLIIKKAGKEILSLDSVKDTNISWRSKYYNLIAFINIELSK